MRRLKYVVVVAALSAASGLVAVAPPASAAGGPLVSAGSVRLSALVSSAGAEGLADPEFPVAREGDGGVEAAPPAGPGARVGSSRVAPAGPELALTFRGINHREHRLASGGNQFSVEPPDQALCVGPGHVLEAVNTTLRVYDKAGAAATAPISLNDFFGYTPAIVRSNPPVFGAFTTDPICHFDADSGRYFLAILTIDQDPKTGNFTGKNRIDLAVSATSDPTGVWNRYKLPTQDDGTEGTPDHGCDPISPADAGPEVTSPAACLGDYPHIGADKNGVYLTTNEYSLFSDGSNGGAPYTGSQIYAISKKQLVAGAPDPTTVHFESPTLGPFRSFTVWPAVSAPTQFDRGNGGTEYFLSTTLGDGSETGNPAASENRVGVWSITNTRSLDAATPRLRLQNRLVPAIRYAVPPQSTQKAGPTPLADCLNDRSDLLAPGVGCWGLLVGAQPTVLEKETGVDSGDGRMQQVVLDRGKLYGAFGTAVNVGGQAKAGVAWVEVDPSLEGGRLSAQTEDSGYVAVAGNNVTYPAVGVTRSGKVVMAATLVGDDHYPTATYTVLGGDRPTVRVISEGVGPKDGFAGYNAFGGGRPRWGDYGATAFDGDRLWLASESIEQSCTLNEWLTGAIGSCGGTRTALANWATRVSAVRL